MRNKGEAMIEKQYGGWYWFSSGNTKKLIPEKCGKWMYFFTDQDFAIGICRKAMSFPICYLCKCSVLEEQGTKEGVICFYQNGDDINNHKLILAFMYKNGLIKQTKTGRLYDISFKFDYQTRAGEYGADFEGRIKLHQFLDLDTHKWIYKKNV